MFNNLHSMQFSTWKEIKTLTLIGERNGRRRVPSNNLLCSQIIISFVYSMQMRLATVEAMIMNNCN